MHDIFLSYATRDRDRLAPLVKALEDQGWSVFWDHRSIKVAQDWHDVISTEIHQCSCVIVAWSGSSVKSKWVKGEALIALERNVLYPILLDTVMVPFGFNLIQAADFRHWGGNDNHPKFVELRDQLSLQLGVRQSRTPARAAIEPKAEQFFSVLSSSVNFIKKNSFAFIGKILRRWISVLGRGDRLTNSGDTAPVFSLSKWFSTMLFSGLLLVIISVSVYFISMYLLLSGEPDLKNRAFLMQLHQYQMAIAVRNKQGDLLGVMANDLKAPAGYIDRDRNGSYRKGTDRDSALYVEKVPEFFWDVLVEREHRFLSFTDESGFIGYIKGVLNRSYRGIDVAAPLLQRLNVLKGRSSTGGGSTLLNIMVKNLYGADNFFLKKANLKKICSPLISWNVTLCRKFIEYRAARDLFPYLARNNGEEFKRWVSTHAGLVGAVGNGAVYGIQGAAAVLFGKRPEELNIAQQSLLASAYKADVRFAHPALNDLEKLEARNNRWNARKEVAHVMAKRILTQQGNSSELPALAHQFDQLGTPKVPEIPSVLKPYFLSDVGNAHKQIKNYANLHTRLRYIMSSFKVLLESDLQRLMEKWPDTGIPVDLVITLPLQEDFELRWNIDKVFESLARRYHFNKNLIFRGKSAGRKSDSASIRISVAELDGEIVRYYLREGDYAVEDKHGLKDRPARSMAGLAKIPLSVLLISKGVRPKDQLCNHYYKGGANTGGDKGVRGCSETFSFGESVAGSKNLSLRYALGEKVAASQPELAKLFADFSIDIDGSDGERINMIENLSFGRARATPSHTHQIMNKMTALVHTQQGLGQPLHTIRSARYILKGLNGLEAFELQGGNKDPLPEIGRYFKEPGSQDAMRQLLEAPIYSKGGTLKFTQNLRNGKMLLGQTGTSYTNRGNIKDMYVVGLLSVKGKPYTFSILVGSEDYGGGGLIEKISTQELMAPLIQAIVDSLYEQVEL